MCRMYADINGSGMHCNMSLFTEDGANAFADPTGDMGLSDVAHSFIAGLLKHAYNFTAITNPTVNSYKRLVPGYEAPVYVAWAGRNRSPLIRVPASRGLSTRVELRAVDPTANPYLALAVLLAAGLDGVEHKLEAPEAIESNIYVMTEEERKKFGTLISGWLADLGMAFVAFGNLWEGILYFDRIYEIQNGHLLEIHNTREGKG